MKRHGYYCRSRKVGTSTRPRSCIACAKAKARCDNKQPWCSRCAGKRVVCRYPPGKPNDRARESGYDYDVDREAVIADDIILDDAPAISNSSLELLDLERSIPNSNDLNIDFSVFFEAQTNGKELQYSPSNLSNLTYNSTPSTDAMVFIPNLDFYPSQSLPRGPNPPRALVQRQRPRYGAQRTADLIVQILRSYPLMMLRDNALPPFIHPHVISSNALNDNMEPITNCISLVHMISGETKGSRKLFWKNVQLECERLCAEVCYVLGFKYRHEKG